MKTLPMLCAAVLLAVNALAKEPKLSFEDASKKAKTAAGGGSVERGELEQKGEKLLWAFDVRSGEKLKTVWLDSDTGELVKLDTESAANRDVYAKVTRRQLDEMETRIDDLKKEAADRSGDVRKTIEDRAGELDKMRREAETELAQLEAAGRDRWLRFKTGLDRAVLELRRGYDDAVSTGTAKAPSSPSGDKSKR